MELKHYLKMLASGWWIIALAGLAALALALVFSYTQTPIYRASARLVVRPNPALTNTSALVDSLSTLDKRSIISTYAEISKSNRLYNAAIANLSLSPSDLLLYTHSTVALPDSNILEVTIQGPDPQITAVIANNLSHGSVDYISTLYQAYSVDLLDPAVVPTAPVSPQPLRDAGLAAALGIILGSLLAIVREQIRIPLESLQQRAMYDSNSEAYTRRYFQRQLEDQVAANLRDVFSLGLVEVRGLGDLEETLPEPIMNKLLRQVTHVLKAELRGGDSVGRWDGSTFSILLPATSEAAARRTLERIQTKLCGPQPLDGMDGDIVDLKPRIGSATIVCNETANDLIQRAKISLEQDSQNPVMPPRVLR